MITCAIGRNHRGQTAITNFLVKRYRFFRAHTIDVRHEYAVFKRPFVIVNSFPFLLPLSYHYYHHFYFKPIMPIMSITIIIIIIIMHHHHHYHHHYHHFHHAHDHDHHHHHAHHSMIIITRIMVGVNKEE